MTKAETKARIQALGLVAQWRSEWGDWRITVPPGSMHHVKSVDDEAREAVAIYTDDNEEALEAARYMRAHFDGNPPPGFKAPWQPIRGII